MSIWWWAIGHGHARTDGHVDLVVGHSTATPAWVGHPGLVGVPLKQKTRRNGRAVLNYFERPRTTIDNG